MLRWQPFILVSVSKLWHDIGKMVMDRHTYNTNQKTARLETRK
ncbi:Uncharacterised protein [Klebsiella quasipneumoniae]|nr:Uncharacterised protein [Klebsiella quasipneumoniae]SBY22837.1 Uncharacterised protein [Klebsiella quasipneumoniae]SBZ51475.1 Uncharacterised protein [Klebsiella quasipneumoniae]